MKPENLPKRQGEGRVAPDRGSPPQDLLALLWPLLERQALLFSGGDTSLPLEEVQRLFESMRFCIEISSENGCRETAPEEQMKAGQRLLWREAEAAKRLWLRASATAPRGSAALDETLASIRRFFPLYDIRFFAAERPASIDYILCIPAPEERKGVRYIGEYLRRLSWENWIIAAFPQKMLGRLWDACRPGWREVPFNLCAPVFASALGLVLAGGAPGALVYSGETYQRLEAMLHGADENKARQLLKQGAARLCSSLCLWETALRRYFEAYAQTLAPALKAAGPQGLRNFFPSA